MIIIANAMAVPATGNIPMVTVIIKRTATKTIGTPIVGIGGLGKTGTDIERNTQGYTNTEDIIEKADS